MLLVTLLGAAAAAGVGLASRIGSDAARMMRRDIFRKVESFSWRNLTAIPLPH